MVNTKIVLLGILAGAAVLLGSCALTLSAILNQRKSQLQKRRAKEKNKSTRGPTSANDNENNNRKKKNNPKSNDSKYNIPSFHPGRDLHRHRNYAPDPSSPRASADAYLYQSMQLFQETDTFPLGDAGPDLYSHYGMDVSLREWENKNHPPHSYDQSLQTQQQQQQQQMNPQMNPQLSQLQGWDLLIDSFSWLSKLNRVKNFLHDLFYLRKSKRRYLSNQNNQNSNTTTSSSSLSSSVIPPKEAYQHLERSAKHGNPHAQHLLANVLASSIFLPSSFHDDPNNNNHTTVPTDFGTSPPMSLVLWHYAAVAGHFESQLAMGYRYLQANRYGSNDFELDPLKRASTSTQSSGGPIGLEHATCETALAYYEEAGHAMMDELERGIWRGKVKPVDDRHYLAEIHFLGGSQMLLTSNNKPDELEEALEYYRIRASSTQTNPFSEPTPPDVHAAMTLGNLHYLGRRGVPQDLSLALHYFEIAADGGNREAAGTAGKFHLLGIGYDGDEMAFHDRYGSHKDINPYRFLGDTERALKYLKMGAPGGLAGCDPKIHQKGDTITPCDAEAMNGLGLVYLVGIPGKVPRAVTTATRFFMLARDRGSADASFHLGMLRLGWWSQGEGDDNWNAAMAIHNDDNIDINTMDETETVSPMLAERRQKMKEIKIQQNTGGGSRFFPPTFDDNDADFVSRTANLAAAAVGKIPKISAEEKRRKNLQIGVTELTKAANKGHIQAVHRLALINSHGLEVNSVGNRVKPKFTTTTTTRKGDEHYIYRPNCGTALNLFKLLLDAAPITSQRTRRAYKQYISGDIIGSLKNYMAAAETGNVVGMMNAAWILDRHCPLSQQDNWKCKRASLRYWVEAGRLGNEEAILNLGDFYYYNKLGDSTPNSAQVPQGGRGQGHIVIQLQKVLNWILFPETLWKDGKSWLIQFTKQFVLRKKRKKSKMNKKTQQTQQTCSTEDGEQTCAASVLEVTKDKANTMEDTTSTSTTATTTATARMEEETTTVEDNLKIAASYYKQAASEHKSARANFNLGFMHQWGIGLTQDFPLAKRHYDLAIGMNPIAVQLALCGMRWHEKLVRWHLKTIEHEKSSKIRIIPGNNGRINVILSHFLTGETGVIIALCMVLQKLLRKRRTRNA